MQENSTYRIRAKVGDATENVINVKLDQHYDMFEILSLKIDQENFYKTYESGYGVIVGRVIANGGFGVPNAKVSVFIESDGNDDIETRIYYPYKSPSSKNADGVRYNLLTDFLDKACYQNVGTFPNKRLVLDNDDVIDVFDKYYRYTTVTNNAGDYMIFGVPTGSQRLHVDVDLSDIGMLSQRPRDMVYKGYNINQFESPNKFRQDKNLNSLAQILTQDIGVYVYPYWGDTSDDTDNIAVTRADIQLDYKFEPTCVFMGSIITDTGSNAIGKNCTSTEKVGKMSELIAGEGSIEMIRKTYDGKVEEFQVKGNRVIDGDGVWCYQIPMNLDYIMTDEFGNIAPSDNPEKGIPTRTRVRFRISLDDAPDDNTARKRCRYLVPNNPRLDEEHFPQFTKTKEPDYEFGSRTREESFKDLLWNKVYTVKNYVPRLQKNRRVTDRKHTGIKLINHHEGNNPMPYNNVDIKLGFTYRLLCVIFKIFINLVQFLNQILTAISLAFCAIYKVFNEIANKLCFRIFGIKPLCWMAWPFRKLADLFKALIVPCVGISSDMCGGNTTHNNTFYPGCGNLMFSGKSAGGLASCIKDKTRESHDKKEDKRIKDGEIDASERTVALLGGTEELYNCVETALAEDNDTISLNFQNDWVNGTLYAPMWFRKITKKRSYLFGLIKRRAKDQWCEGEKNYTRKILRVFNPCSPKRPGRVNYDNFDGKSVTAHYMNYSDDKRFADSCRDKCHESTKAINLDKGLIVKRQTMLGQDVYYYKPVEFGSPQESLIENSDDFAVGEQGFDSGSLKLLFATDIVLLGSLNDCDIHGVPQFYRSLESTTFQIPPNILFTDNEIIVEMSKGSTNNASDDDPDNVKVEYTVTEQSTSEMTGMDWGNFNEDICGRWSDSQDSGLFYSIGCSTIKMKPKSCINMTRICEFGVSLDETTSFIKKDVSVTGEDTPIDNVLYDTITPDGFISKDELYNDDERSLFATLNINGLDTSRNPENGLMEYTFKHVVVNNFDKSLYAYMFERQSRCGFPQRFNYMLEEFSKGYYDFRMGKQPYFYDKEYKFPRYENSFYFYFGLNPGKTAIDKFNSQFTSDCTNPNENLDPIDIEPVGNTWCSEMWGEGDGYVAFNLSYIDLPCDIVITNVSDASFGEVSFTNVEDEMFYVSRVPRPELEEKGYVRYEISKEYTNAQGTNFTLTYFLNGVYDVVVTDNNGEIIMTSFTMKADQIKSYVVGTDFTEAKNVLLNKFGNECDVAANRYCFPANENLNINSTRGVGGTIVISMPYNSRSGETIESFKIEIVLVGSDPLQSFLVTYCNNRIQYSGGNCISLLGNNKDVFVFGVPRGDETYRVTITEMCCKTSCSDCSDSNNVYSEDIRIKSLENFKLFINGTVDYDVIKHWKSGFDCNTENRTVTASGNISENWWHMTRQENYLWFNYEPYNEIDKSIVQLIGFYNNAVDAIRDAGYGNLYDSLKDGTYEAKRNGSLSLGSFLRKSDITILNYNDNEYDWSPKPNSAWEDDYEVYGGETGYIAKENERLAGAVADILDELEGGYDLYLELLDKGYVTDYADFITKIENGEMCKIVDGDCKQIIDVSNPDDEEYTEITFADALDCWYGDDDISNITETAKEQVEGVFNSLISVNEEIIELLAEVSDIKREFVSETKKAFQLGCPNDEKNIFFVAQTRHKPVTYYGFYKPEMMEYDDNDTSYYTVECEYLYTTEGESVDMITIPTITYKDSESFGTDETDSVHNGLASDLCYAYDNLSNCDKSQRRKYCYFVAVRNRRGRRIPSDVLPAEANVCPDSIPESVDLQSKLFGYHIIDKIFNKSTMTWVPVDNVPYFKPITGGCIDDEKAGVSMCMNGLFTGKIYNGNVTEDIPLEGTCAHMMETIFPQQLVGNNVMTIYTALGDGETIEDAEDKMPTRRYIVGSSNSDNNAMPYENFRVTKDDNGTQEDSDNTELWNNCEMRQQYTPVVKKNIEVVLEDESACQLIDTIDGRMKITLDSTSVNLSSVKKKNRRKGCKLNVKLQNTGNAEEWLFLVFSAKGENGAIEYPLNLTERATPVYYTKDISESDFINLVESGSLDLNENNQYYLGGGRDTLITADNYNIIVEDSNLPEADREESVYRMVDADTFNSLPDGEKEGFVKLDESGCRKVKFDCNMGLNGAKLFNEDIRNLFSYYNNIKGYRNILSPFARLIGLQQSFGDKPTATELSSKYVVDEDNEFRTYGFGSTGEFTFNDIEGLDDSYYVVAITDNNVRAISPVYDFPYVCAKLIFGIVYSKKETVDENGMVNGYEYVESYRSTFDIANVVINPGRCDETPVTIPTGCVQPDKILYYFFYYPYDISFECKLDEGVTISGSYRHPAYRSNPYGYELFSMDKATYDSLYGIYKGSNQKVGSKIRGNTKIMAKDYVGLNHDVDWYGCRKSDVAKEYGCGLPYEHNIWVEIVWVTNGGRWKKTDPENCDYYVDADCGCDASADCYYGTESDFTRTFKKGDTYHPYHVGSLEKDNCGEDGGFKGWATSYDSMDTIDPASPDITLQGVQNESMIYYAVWACDFVTVEFKDCNGNVISEEKVRKGIVYMKDDMPKSEMPSVVFVAWRLEGEDEDIDFEPNGYTIEGDTVFVARCGSECRPIVDFYNCVDIMPYKIGIVYMKLCVWESEGAKDNGDDPIRAVDITWGPVHGIGSPDDPSVSNNAVYDTHPTAYPEGSYVAMDIVGVELVGGNESGCLIYTNGTAYDCPEDAEGVCELAKTLCGNTDIIITGGKTITDRCSDLVFKAVLTQNNEDCSCSTMYTVKWLKDCPAGDLYFTNYVCIGDYISLPQRNPTKDGEVFKEWNDGYNGDIIMSRVSSTTHNVDGVITICAVWEGDSSTTHTVEFYAGNTHLTSYDTAVQSGEKLELNDIPSDNHILVPTGKTWDGKWTYTVDVGGGVYVGSDKYTRDEIHENISITVNTRFVAEFTDTPQPTDKIVHYSIQNSMEGTDGQSAPDSVKPTFKVVKPTSSFETFEPVVDMPSGPGIVSKTLEIEYQFDYIQLMSVGGFTEDNAEYSFGFGQDSGKYYFNLYYGDTQITSLNNTYSFSDYEDEKEIKIVLKDDGNTPPEPTFYTVTFDWGWPAYTSQDIIDNNPNPANQTIYPGEHISNPGTSPFVANHQFYGWICVQDPDKVVVPTSDISGIDVESDLDFIGVWKDHIVYQIINNTDFETINHLTYVLQVNVSGTSNFTIDSEDIGMVDDSVENYHDATSAYFYPTEVGFPENYAWQTLKVKSVTFVPSNSTTFITLNPTSDDGTLKVGTYASATATSETSLTVSNFMRGNKMFIRVDKLEIPKVTASIYVMGLAGDAYFDKRLFTTRQVEKNSSLTFTDSDMAQMTSVVNSGNPGKYRFYQWENSKAPNGYHMAANEEFTAMYDINIFVLSYIYDNGDSPTVTQPSWGTVIVLPQAPTRSGYVFTGWKLYGTDDIYNAGDTYGEIKSDLTFTAQWQEEQAITHTVTFRVRDDEAGTILGTFDPITVEDGHVLTSSEIPTEQEILNKTGNPDAYYFDVWRKGSNPANFEDPITADTTFTALVYKNAYEVKYVHNNGTGTVYVVRPYPSYGENVTIMAGPTYDGYNFAGWLCENDGQTYYEGNIYRNITENLTFTAQWTQVTPTTHTVRFVFGHGIDDVVISNVEHGSTVTPPSDPGLDGYQLNGWSSNPNAPIMQDMTFTAIWKIRVIFKAEGSTIDTQYVYENGNVTIPTVTVGTGRRFKDKWTKEGHSTQYTSDTVAGWAIQEPLVLVAVIVDVYTVEFYVYNNGTESRIGNVHTVESGNTVTPPNDTAISNAISGTGMSRLSQSTPWRISNANGTFNTYGDTYATSWFSNGITSNMKFFLRTAYSVTFNFDQPTLENVTQTIEQGHHASVPTPGAVENCTFTGNWNSSVSGLATDSAITANVTFTALWDCQEPQPTGYTVTWLKCDGSTLRTDTNVPENTIYGTTQGYNYPSGNSASTFSGGTGCLFGGEWTKSPMTINSKITSDSTFTPVCSCAGNTYTIQFGVYNNMDSSQQTPQFYQFSVPELNYTLYGGDSSITRSVSISDTLSMGVKKTVEINGVDAYSEVNLNYITIKYNTGSGDVATLNFNTGMPDEHGYIATIHLYRNNVPYSSGGQNVTATNFAQSENGIYMMVVITYQPPMLNSSNPQTSSGEDETE